MRKETRRISFFVALVFSFLVTPAHLFADEPACASYTNRLLSADLVITGQVVTTDEAWLLNRDIEQNEDHPLWTDAIVLVDDVLMGKFSPNQIILRIRYPRSEAPKWKDVPQFNSSWKGIVFLRMNDTLYGTLPWVGSDILYTALSAEDAHDMNTAPLIRRCIAELGGNKGDK